MELLLIASYDSFRLFPHPVVMNRWRSMELLRFGRGDVGSIPTGRVYEHLGRSSEAERRIVALHTIIPLFLIWRVVKNRATSLLMKPCSFRLFPRFYLEV